MKMNLFLSSVGNSRYGVDFVGFIEKANDVIKINKIVGAGLLREII